MTVTPFLYFLLIVFDIIFVLTMLIFFFFNIRNVHMSIIDGRLWIFYTRTQQDGFINGMHHEQKYSRVLIDFNNLK